MFVSFNKWILVSKKIGLLTCPSSISSRAISNSSGKALPSLTPNDPPEFLVPSSSENSWTNS